jgi:hypothetical protein
MPSSIVYALLGTALLRAPDIKEDYDEAYISGLVYVGPDNRARLMYCKLCSE